MQPFPWASFPFKKLTDPCFVFSGPRTGERQAVINMHPPSCKREVVPSPTPWVKKFKNKKTECQGSDPLFPLPSSAPQTSSHRMHLTGRPFPKQSLPIWAPGSASTWICPRALPGLAECEEYRALWCHPTAIWGAQQALKLH